MSLTKKLILFITILAVAAAISVVISRNLHDKLSLKNSVFANKMGYEMGLRPKPSWVGQYLSGYHATQNKNYEKASDFFANSLALSANSEVLQTQAMSLLLVSGKFPEAVKIAKTLNDKSDNGLARLTLIVDAVQRNDLQEAERLTLQKQEDAGTIINQVIYGWVKYGQGDKEKALEIMRELRGDEVFLPFIDYNYALIANLSGDKVTARKLFDILLNSNQLPNGISAAAYDFYKEQNDLEKLKIIKEKFAYDGSVSKHPKITNVKDGVAESLLGVGGIILTQYSPDKSAALFRLALYLNPKLDDAKLLLGSILMSEGDYRGANEILSQISQDSYLGDYAKLAIAKNFEAMDQNDKAFDYFKALTKSKETSIDAFVALGDLARKKEDYKGAAEFYTQAIDSAKANAPNGKIESRYWALYFARGVCYERMKEMDKAEADLLVALQLQPNQPDVMNYLAYSWIDANKNLVQAKDMVLKAHTQKPEDPQIIDSVGWAYFKIGNYKNSVEYLEHAASLLPYDPTVNDHLGDAYWQTGRKNEARFQWQRALKNDPEPKLADELKKKLENGLQPDNVATQTSDAS